MYDNVCIAECDYNMTFVLCKGELCASKADLLSALITAEQGFQKIALDFDNNDKAGLYLSRNNNGELQHSQAMGLYFILA